jgi:hypothetical protein
MKVPEQFLMPLPMCVLSNKIGKVHYLEYTKIPEVFFMPYIV